MVEEHGKHRNRDSPFRGFLLWSGFGHGFLDDAINLVVAQIGSDLVRVGQTFEWADFDTVPSDVFDFYVFNMRLYFEF